MTSSPFARLPSEIIRVIFDRATDLLDPPTTLSLTLVSRTVRHWVEPALYHTVILRSPHTVHLFRTGAFSAKPLSFFAAHVHHLFVNGDDVADIIRACANVRRLAAYPPALLTLPDHDEIGPDLETPWPKPIEVSLMGELDDVPWASPLFFHTRYLYLALEPPSPATACDLSVLPSLKTLAFPYDDEDDPDGPSTLLRTIHVLLESTTLRALLVLINNPEGNPDRSRKGSIWHKLANVQDRRLYVRTEPTCDGEDWAEMVQSGTYYWDHEDEWKDWRAELITTSSPCDVKSS